MATVRRQAHANRPQKSADADAVHRGPSRWSRKTFSRRGPRQPVQHRGNGGGTSQQRHKTKPPAEPRATPDKGAFQCQRRGIAVWLHRGVYHPRYGGISPDFALALQLNFSSHMSAASQSEFLPASRPASAPAMAFPRRGARRMGRGSWLPGNLARLIALTSAPVARQRT